MIQRESCIHVFSDLNPWIDFCILVSEDAENIAEKIINDAYNDWFECPFNDITDPIADYIGNRLQEKGIEYTMYFNNKENE